MSYAPEQAFREIVMADLAAVILIVPTDTVIPPRPQTPLGIPMPKRIYSEQGWAFQRNQLIGTIEGLKLNSPGPEDSPFQISKRLTLGVPLSFELSSEQRLPAAIAAKARFLYQFESAPSQHYGLFQDLVPQFVRIYPFKSAQQFSAQITQFLAAEQAFWQQRHRLSLKNELP